MTAVNPCAKRYLLCASEWGRQQITSDLDGPIGLSLWVKRILSAGWWPLPGRTIKRHPRVERGSEALVYVGEPVQHVIARVVMDHGPELRTTGDDVQPGYRLLDVDVLLPMVPRARLGSTPVRRGVTQLRSEVYDDVLRFVRGSQAWRPRGVDIEPEGYRVFRTVIVEQERWTYIVEQGSWPTVDKQGRLRFDPWASQPLDEPDIEDVSRGLEGEVSFIAISRSGQTIADVTDEALGSARLAHEAAEGGVLEEVEIERLGLWDAAE